MKKSRKCRNDIVLVECIALRIRTIREILLKCSYVFFGDPAVHFCVVLWRFREESELPFEWPKECCFGLESFASFFKFSFEIVGISECEHGKESHGCVPRYSTGKRDLSIFPIFLGKLFAILS